jgi:hypothetical protein
MADSDSDLDFSDEEFEDPGRLVPCVHVASSGPHPVCFYLCAVTPQGWKTRMW